MAPTTTKQWVITSKDKGFDSLELRDAPILKLAYGNGLLQDTQGMAAILRASELDWTLVRAPRVTARRRPAAMSTNVRSLGPWSKVSRVNVATFMLSCLDDESSIRRAPMICDRGPSVH